MGLAALCYQSAVAATLLAGGANVVLCGPDAAALSEAAVALIRPHEGAAAGGRLALFVGDRARAEEPALAMARELFGPDAVVVRSMSEAVQLLALAPGSDELASGTVDTHP